ncbi:xanthine dehydrogenase accessory protein XdhC [Vreelandella sp. GE22]
MKEATLSTWHAALDYCQRNALPHVLATQVTAMGSTPREPGARMVITLEGVVDTLGGGTFEWQTIEAARRYLRDGETGFHLEAFSLGGRSGQCCGGFVNIMLEVFAGAKTHLAVFGAGHIGRHIIELTHPLPWQRYWFDSRPDTLSRDTDTPRLNQTLLDDPVHAIQALPPHCHAIVATHSHDEDYALIEALIEQEDVASIGLIGSESKWASFKGRLERAGHSTAQIERVRSPIGVFNGAKLYNKAPYAIALSAVTELLWLTDCEQPTSIRGLESTTLKPLFKDSPSYQ